MLIIYLHIYDNSTEASKLGVQGVTILVASGDDGALSSTAVGNPGNCGYSPLFPASSPYVLSVGATSGPESNNPEIACQSFGGDILITSGGGFSNLYSRPSFQDTAINNYFSSVDGTSQQPVSGFNSNGRGYPDISAMGHAYYLFIGKRDNCLI